MSPSTLSAPVLILPLSPVLLWTCEGLISSMRFFSRAGTAASLLAVAQAAPQMYPISSNDTADSAARAAFVKDIFQTAFNGYLEFAFPNDELLPVNNSFDNSL